MQANRLLTGAILCLIPAFGHHSVSAEFDVSRTVRMSGTISKVEFLNPHVTISLDVKNPDGTVTLWKVETRSPNVLQRLGITKALLAQGTTISVDANPSKDGTPVANGLALTLADGRELALSPRDPCKETAHPANCIQQADNTNGFWK
jgi:Family of unknown function (DUF6152)